MAKVTGPLMSMDASGKFGGALVFGKWKGRPTVRKLVTPSNPQTADQTAARNAVRCLGAGQRFASLTALIIAAVAVLDKVALGALAPSGQAWNGFLVKSAIGAGSLNYEAATAAYAALTAPEKAAWVAAADALVPAIPAVAQQAEGGVAATPLTSGEVFYHYAYGLYMAGVLDTAPGAVPPVYA
jgi:hypothetical protein